MIGAVRPAAHAPPDRIGWRGFVLVGAGVTALVIFTLRALLFSQADVLPGTDASNLYAWELYTRSVLALGRLPHWNPYLLSGTPHLADTQTTVLYPPAMLLRWLPPAPYFSWMAALHMAIGGVGAAFLARVIGVRWVAAAAAGIAVTLGGSVPGWIYNGHLLLLYGSSWLPWILATALISFRRPRVWPHPALVILLVVQFLAGYLQGSIYVGAAVLICALWCTAWPEDDARGRARWRPLGQVAVAGVLAAGLAAFQLWPTLQLVESAGRTAGLPYSAAVRGGWSSSDLATFLFPFEGVSAITPFRNLADRTAYVGWVLVSLALIAWVGRDRRRSVGLFAILAAGSIAFAMAATLPFYRLHFLLFPGLRVPGRLLFVTTLSVAILGAIGIDRLADALEARGKAMAGAVVTALLLALVTVDLGAYARGSVQLSSPQPAPALFAIPQVPGRSLSVCDRALGAMDLVIGGRPAADGAGAVVLADYAAFQELARDEGPLRMRRDLLDLLNVTSIVSCEPLDGSALTQTGAANPGLVFHNESAWPRALWTCGAEHVTRREALDHLRQVRYDDQRRLDRRYFVNIRWAASVDEARRRSLESRFHLAEGVRRDGNTWRYDLQDRSRSNVRTLLADASVEDTHGIDRETAEVAASSDEREDELLFGTSACEHTGVLTGLNADRPGGDVRVVSDAPADGLVFMSEPYYPERMAYVDNTAVAPLKADVAFMAIPVPAGRHVVEVRYVPHRFREGLAVTAVTLVAWIGGVGWLPWRRRRQSSKVQTAA